VASTDLKSGVILLAPDEKAKSLEADLAVFSHLVGRISQVWAHYFALRSASVGLEPDWMCVPASRPGRPCPTRAEPRALTMSFHPLFGSSKDVSELLKARTPRCAALDPASPYVSRGIAYARSGRLGRGSPKREKILWGPIGIVVHNRHAIGPSHIKKTVQGRTSQRGVFPTQKLSPSSFACATPSSWTCARIELGPSPWATRAIGSLYVLTSVASRAAH
jgi:hypothetical protein